MLPTQGNMQKALWIKDRWLSIKGNLMEASNILERWLFDSKPPGNYHTLKRVGYAKEYVEIDLMLTWRHLNDLAKEYSAANLPGMFWYYMAKASEEFIDIVEHGE